MRSLPLLLAGALLSASVSAQNLSSLSQDEASDGLKDALEQSVQLAVKQLGKPGGFANDPLVRIELPGRLEQAARLMKQVGLGAQADELEKRMNLAAEAAVPQARTLLAEAVRNMTLADAKGILSGGEDSATQYLKRSSGEQLRQRFLPIVAQATEQFDLTQQYNALASQAATFGMLDNKHGSIEEYVTEQTLNGLFKVIGQQEKGIRGNPAAAATGLAQRVLSAH
ncbi:DUF4197 domain-containing protein [Pseudomonas panipatensis]|uniref:DUF4197 domain-containing protein n=1 Tax=Pseudomonas panipatensis TaxID=428992 RepID=UPI0035B3BBDA